MPRVTSSWAARGVFIGAMPVQEAEAPPGTDCEPAVRVLTATAAMDQPGVVSPDEVHVVVVEGAKPCFALPPPLTRRVVVAM